jgi:hypothetical protein
MEGSPDREPTFQEKEWAQAGKALLAITGLACLALALYQRNDSLSLVLRIWVGGFGIFSVLVALRDSQRRP